MTTSDFYDQLVSLQGSLGRFAYYLTSDKEDAKDLTQDTMLKALAFRQQFEEATNLQAWTYTIMKNTYINHYRKRMRQSTCLGRATDLSFLGQNKDTHHVTPDSMLHEKEITKAIDRLDGEFRVTFMMYVNGYKYKDIADILGISLGTVKSRMFFARRKLAKALPGYHNKCLSGDLGN